MRYSVKSEPQWIRGRNPRLALLNDDSDDDGGNPIEKDCPTYAKVTNYAESDDDSEQN